MTDEGWKQYHKLCQSRQVSRNEHINDYVDEAPPHGGGVGGFQNATEPKRPVKEQPTVDTPPKPSQASYWWQKEEPLAEEIPEHFLMVDPPCQQCGCAFQRKMAEYQVCVCKFWNSMGGF